MTMLGWERRAAAWASRWKRCLDSSLRPGVAAMVLMATNRFKTGSFAL